MTIKHSDNPASKSFLTLQIYLNEDYGDGETCLLNQIDGDNILWRKIRPQTGKVIIFDHKITHKALP